MSSENNASAQQGLSPELIAAIDNRIEEITLDQIVPGFQDAIAQMRATLTALVNEISGIKATQVELQTQLTELRPEVEVALNRRDQEIQGKIDPLTTRIDEVEMYLNAMYIQIEALRHRPVDRVVADQTPTSKPPAPEAEVLGAIVQTMHSGAPGNGFWTVRLLHRWARDLRSPIPGTSKQQYDIIGRMLGEQMLTQKPRIYQGHPTTETMLNKWHGTVAAILQVAQPTSAIEMEPVEDDFSQSNQADAIVPTASTAQASEQDVVDDTQAIELPPTTMVAQERSVSDTPAAQVNSAVQPVGRSLREKMLKALNQSAS